GGYVTYQLIELTHSPSGRDGQSMARFSRAASCPGSNRRRDSSPSILATDRPTRRGNGGGATDVRRGKVSPSAHTTASVRTGRGNRAAASDSRPPACTGESWRRPTRRRP